MAWISFISQPVCKYANFGAEKGVDDRADTLGQSGKIPHNLQFTHLVEDMLTGKVEAIF